MYRLTVGLPQRPMAATTCSGTSALPAVSTEKLVADDWDLKSYRSRFDSGYHGCHGADSTDSEGNKNIKAFGNVKLGGEGTTRPC